MQLYVLIENFPLPALIPIIGIVLMIGMIFLSIYMDKKNRILRKLKKIPTRKIASVKENEYIKIIGTAQTTGPLLISPIGKRECIGYQIKVERKRGGKNRSWKTIIYEENFPDFIIDSPQGKAVVTLPNNKDHRMI